MIDPSIIDDKLTYARAQLGPTFDALKLAIGSIGMTRKYTGHEPAADLEVAISNYVDAKARVVMLELIRSPDFYASIMRSAAEVEVPR